MKFTLIPLLLAAVGMSGCCALSKDQRTAYEQANVPPAVCARINSHERLSDSDIIDLSRSGVRSSQIIAYLSVSKTNGSITPQEAQHLREQGVSGDVVAYMQDRPENKGGLFSLF